MRSRFWLATAASVAIVITGTFVAGPIVHGQAEKSAKPAPSDRDTKPDPEALAREIEEAVKDALESAGVSNGRLSADMERAVEEATRSAQDVVGDLDVRVLVDEAMQGAPDVAMLTGRPRIGASTRDVTAEEAKAAGLNGISGALVTSVTPESVAGRAGLQANDVIVSVDGEAIRSARHLARVIAETPEGRALQIAYVRGTTKATATLTPEVRSLTLRGRDGERAVVRRFERRMGPDARPFVFRGAPGADVRVRVGRGRLGVMAQPLTEQLATYFGVKDGLLVTQVSEGSPAAKAGIKAGDVINAVNGKPVKDTGEILEALQGVEDGKDVAVEITRDRKRQSLTVTLATRSGTSDSRTTPSRPRFTA